MATVIRWPGLGALLSLALAPITQSTPIAAKINCTAGQAIDDGAFAELPSGANWRSNSERI